MPTKKYTIGKERVPGTTTVIGASLGWGKEGLLHWAWKQGSEGKDYREARDKSAEAGTIAHALAEADVKGDLLPGPRPGDDEASWEKARACFGAYLEWKEMSKVEILYSEVSLVSLDLRFGGTLDGVGKFKNRVELIDFKNTNGTYPEHMIQLAAYRHLWEKGAAFEAPEIEAVNREKISGVHLLRFSPKGDFHHSYYQAERMDRPWEAFKLLRGLYDLKKEIEGMV